MSEDKDTTIRKLKFQIKEVIEELNFWRRKYGKYQTLSEKGGEAK